MDWVKNLEPDDLIRVAMETLLCGFGPAEYANDSRTLLEGIVQAAYARGAEDGVKEARKILIKGI